MIVTTTTAVDGRTVTEYAGVVTGEAILGTNVFRDVFAGLRDIVAERPPTSARCARRATRPCARWSSRPKTSAPTPSSAWT